MVDDRPPPTRRGAGIRRKAKAIFNLYKTKGGNKFPKPIAEAIGMKNHEICRGRKSLSWWRDFVVTTARLCIIAYGYKRSRRIVPTIKSNYTVVCMVARRAMKTIQSEQSLPGLTSADIARIRNREERSSLGSMYDYSLSSDDRGDY